MIMKTFFKTKQVFAGAIALIQLISIGSYSQQEALDDKTLSPYFFIKSDHPGTDQLPLKATSAEVNIAGVIADVKVKQVYKNSGLSVIEAIYVFPASTKAAVNGMKMTIGERTIVAKIERKDKARQEYEAARQAGKSVSLLEQQRPNVFQMNVANILPGDEIIVELNYTELLIPEDGIYEFVYPTVVGPRYSNTPEILASSNERWISNPYTKEGEPPLYTFNLEVNLSTGLPVSDVICNTHQVDINFLSKDKVKVDLKETEKFGGNRDFILNFKLKGNQIQSGLLLYEGKDENFFLAMIQPPKLIMPEMIPSREYVFIMDVSGSMHGFPIEISKSLLKDLIGNLRTIDKFNVILFAGGSEIMSGISLEANSTNIQKAIDFIDKQQGGGGTELLPALKRALALNGTENFSRTFIIATDGYVTVEKEAFDLIRQNLGTANFFTFGIGTSVNRYILEGMAHVGKGLPFIATSQSEATKMAGKFRNYVSNPALTNIQIDFNGFDVYDVEPLEVPDIFSDRPVLIYGKYKGQPTGFIQLKGENGGLGINQRLDLTNFKPSNQNSGIRSLWAREKIRILDDYTNLAQNDTHSEEMTALGLKYNLLTSYTSFVAIDSEVRNQNGNITTVKQPLPLPDGVSNNAVGTALFMGGIQSPKCYSIGRYDNLQLSEQVESELEENSDVVFQTCEILPEYIGGNDSLMSFIINHIVYPEEAKKLKISGTVFVEFEVNTDGTIGKISIVRSVNTLLDQEAMRVIKLTNGKWKPGMQSGKKVKTSMVIPVKFQL
jgi:Ca-activated chloride channel family protein